MRSIRLITAVISGLLFSSSALFAQTQVSTPAETCKAWIEAIPVSPANQATANTQCLEAIGAGNAEALLPLLNRYLAQDGQFLDPMALTDLTPEETGLLPLTLETIIAQSARRQDVDIDRADLKIMIARASASDMETPPVVMAGLYFADSVLALIQGDARGMRQAAETALSYADATTARPLRTRILISIGVAATQQGEYNVALENYEAAIKSAEADGNSFRMATTSANIGSLFSSLGDDDQAMEYYEQALTYGAQDLQANPLFEAGMLANIGSILTDAGRHEEAISYYERSEDVLVRLNQRELDPFLNFSYAQSLFEIDETERALTLGEKAADQALAQGNTPLAGLALVWLAEKQLDQSNPEIARQSLAKASELKGVGQKRPEELASDGEEFYWTIKYAEGMARMMAATGEYEEASAYAAAAFDLHNRRFDREIMDAAVNSELLFNLRAQQDALEASEANVTRAEERAALAEERTLVETLRTQRTQLIALASIIAAIAAILIGLGIYRSYRTQKALADARNVFLQETHHRIKNNLQLLISVLKRENLDRQKKGANDPDTETLNATERLRAMALIQDYLYTNDEGTQISSHDYFSNLFDGIRASLTRDDVEIDLQIDDVPLDAEIAMRLGLFTFEALSNSFKHAFAETGGELSVRLEQVGRGERVNLIVQDNGAGDADLANSKSRGGLSLIRDFADMLNAALDIRSDQTGTRISLGGVKTA